MDGVGSVTVLGGLEREIQVEVDIDKLNALGLSIAQVSQAIRGENLNLPAGRSRRRIYDFLLRTKAEFARSTRLPRSSWPTPAGNPVYLRDVAAVSDSFKTRQDDLPRQRRRVRHARRPEAVRARTRVKVADGVNTDDGPRSAEAYPDLEIQPGHRRVGLHQGIARRRHQQPDPRGASWPGIVVLFSFGDLRNTLITIAGLPVCIIGTFAVMGLLGFTVNVITLLALSLSVGLLIDDAIVVRENIFRHMEKLGKDPMQAASDGTAEVGLAVTATTLTLVAVFLPVAFATGIAGKFFRQFGITVAAAVLISLFEAFTFAPMLSAYFFKKARRPATEHSCLQPLPGGRHALLRPAGPRLPSDPALGRSATARASSSSPWPSSP